MQLIYYSKVNEIYVFNTTFSKRLSFLKTFPKYKLPFTPFPHFLKGGWRKN